jgi:hypothetical protein
VANLVPRKLLFFPTICVIRETKKNLYRELHARTNFQLFLSKALCSSFKKLVISMPSLLLLELSKMGTYVTYPYPELHGYRVLVT